MLYYVELVYKQFEKELVMLFFGKESFEQIKKTVVDSVTIAVNCALRSFKDDEKLEAELKSWHGNILKELQN